MEIEVRRLPSGFAALVRANGLYTFMVKAARSVEAAINEECES
jgi:hypothetical protein